MFGLFKKKVTPPEFGYGILRLAGSVIVDYAEMSLRWCYDDFNVNDDRVKFLESKGIPVPKQHLYFRLFCHSAIQAACTKFDEYVRRAITQGAIAGFKNGADGYDFDSTYRTLEAAYIGQHIFDCRVEPLKNANAQLNFLPNPYVGVINAKYLVSSFVLPNMKDSKIFIDGFKGYSSSVSSVVGVVRRAMDQLFESFKI